MGRIIKIFVATSLLAFILPRAEAQERLTLESAIGIALEHNYDVQVAAMDRKVQQNLAERGNAGLLPTVFIDGQATYQLDNTRIDFASPEITPIEAEGAQTISMGGNAIVEYVLFDGGRRISTLHVLESQSEDARLREKLAMESTSLEVANQYLETLRLSDAEAIAEEAVLLSLERVERAQENYNYGNFTRLQLLNAEVDLRADSIVLAETRLERIQASRNLFFVMGLPPDTSLAIDSAFAFSAGLDKEALLDGARTRNTAFLRMRNQVYEAEQSLKVSQAERHPTLGFQGGYSYSFSDFEANFLDRQELAGWNAGLNLRFYLFDGGRIRRNISNAKLNIAMAEVEEKRAHHEITALINNAWDAYITSRQLLQLSMRNLALAEANYDRSREAFASGQITGTELRDAQINLVRTRNEISVRRIRAKLAELGLLFEAGVLLE